MDFFKRRLIITVAAVVLIAIDKIYADPIPVRVCVEKLEKAGYKPSDDGLKNYIDHILNKAIDAGSTEEKFQKQNKTIDPFDAGSTEEKIQQQNITIDPFDAGSTEEKIQQQNITIDPYENCITNQWEKQGSHVDNLEKYYRCYLIVYMRDLTGKIVSANKWCANNWSAIVEPNQTISPFLICLNDLKKDGFLFSSGIDSYAFSLRFKNDDKYKQLKRWTKLYYTYLQTEDVKNIVVLENTRQWCQNFNSEVELHEAGFSDRYHGLSNYKHTVEEKYKSDCNHESLKGKSKDYCEHLKRVYENSNMAGYRRSQKLSEDPGTHVWCKNWKTEIYEGENRETDIHEDLKQEFVCVEKLESFGYKSSNDGLINYIIRIFKKFFDDAITVQQFTADIEQFYKKCRTTQWINQGILDDNLKIYYACYLVVYTRHLPVRVNSVRIWCAENISVPAHQTVSPYFTCYDDIRTDQFDFPYGIDGFALSIWIKSNKNKNENLKKFTKRFVAYLSEKGRKNFYKLQNTTSWCNNFECEVKLHNSGFDDRYDGLENYKQTVVKKYGSKCDSLNGIAKKYCDDLISVYKNSDPEDTFKKLIENPGTIVWCKFNNLRESLTSQESYQPDN